MKKMVPAESPDAYVEALCGWRRNLVETLRRAVLAAGKHVICEKPVAGSLRQADELIVAEAQSGRRVMPIFQYRFGRGLQKLKWLRDHGVLAVPPRGRRGLPANMCRADGSPRFADPDPRARRRYASYAAVTPDTDGGFLLRAFRGPCIIRAG